MDNSNRRHFLKDLGLGAAAFSAAAEGAQGGQMPGRPPSGSAEMEPAQASNIMAIAAHPGDAFFAMGAAVALQVQRGGEGVF